VSARAQALQSTPGGARPGLRLGVCARAVHEAGGDAVDELAVVLGQVAAWLRAGEQVGRAPADVVGALAVSVAIGREPFVEIAKLRAARAVIAALAEACGVTAERVDLRITGHSSARELTRRDPWVNLLRGTLVGIAGVLGGVDALEIAPLDALDAEHGAFGARMAIATHRLLRDEAHLAVTADPTAGSYAIEAATEALARAAWQRFRELEAAGGFDAWLARGSLHALVEARARELAARVREGSLALLGSNLHPPKATHAVPKGEWTVPAPQPAGADPSTRGGGDVPPLPRLRLEDFTADASPIATVATTHGAA
jgi:methylmalonyl-CoA mutase